MKRKAMYIIYLFSFLWLIWITISFFEVTSKNIEDNPQYNENNAFVLFLEVADD